MGCASRRAGAGTGLTISLCLAAGLVAQPVAAAQTALEGRSAETMIVVISGSCTPVAASAAGAAGPTCAQQQPVLAQMQAGGATVLSTTSLIDTITATMAPSEAQVIASLPGVAQVVPDTSIALVQPGQSQPTNGAPPARTTVPGGPGWRSHGNGTPTCGTQARPELGPEALAAIDAPGAWSQGVDGAGVTVAAIADGIDTSNPDLQRNPWFGNRSEPVAQQVDFSGDPAGTPTPGAEMYLDVSSIAAQGNEEYNLAQYVNPGQAARMPAAGCWVKIVGAAPGANVMALKVFSDVNDTTESKFIQAVQYAVQHGAKVLNESFGSYNFPDTTLDVLREANDAAVAAGTTVVVSSGDAGNTNTIESPASDPDVIDVGASTTLRTYAQTNYGGFYNPAVGNGRWVDNNISALSSGGFAQAGNTVDVVAPGDLNWALCSTDTTLYTECADIYGGTDIGIQPSGGTSEAAPLTSAAAADVIEAYANTHGGADPSPALVKQVLVSSATDIGAPADEQGAGLVDIAAAVRLAESLPGPSHRPFPGAAHQLLPGAAYRYGHRPMVRPGGLLIGPSQVNFVGAPGATQQQQISVINTSESWQHVDLSTRSLSDKVYDTGVQSFNLDPASLTANSGTLPIWSGVTEVYQTETFHVAPAMPGQLSRLRFSADYQFSGQGSVLHIALFQPDGTYAAYSEPQGLADFANVEVTDPVPGTWTALFFTELDGATGPGSTGTSGPVQWDAQTWAFGPGGAISPASLNIPPGQTGTALLSLTTPSAAGDTDQSVVISSDEGLHTTVPVTIRSVVPIGSSGGTFSGVLTGGNGRQSAPAESNSYYFAVPSGEKDLDVSVNLADNNGAGLVAGNSLVAYLVSPGGATVGYASNWTLVPQDGALQPAPTMHTQIYHLNPQAGQWKLLLYWDNPVVGDELRDAFTGSVQFNQVSVSSNLPGSASTTLSGLTTTAFDVNVTNTGVAPQAYFVDARLDNQTQVLNLSNLNSTVTANAFTIPLPGGLSFPYYLVPTNTTQLQADVTSADGATPVTFDMEYFPGDPDLSPAVPSPGAVGSYGPGRAALSYSATPEVSPGLWLVNPDEIGPFPPSGEPVDQASASLSAVTEAFDPAVSSSTGNLWDGSLSNFLYLLPGQSGTITVNISPTADAGTITSGTLYVDDVTLGSLVGVAWPDGDEMAAIPYQYKVG